MKHQHLSTVTLLLLITTLLCTSGTVQAQEPDATYRFVKTNSIVQQKNYYLLTLFQELPAVRRLLEQDEDLNRIAKDKIYSLEHAEEQCNQQNRFCYTERMKFTATEITAVSRRLAALYDTDNALGKLVKEHLIPSGTYILYRDKAPLDMLIKAWEQDARGINYAISIYAEGDKPKYPKIDSISFNVYSSQYVATVRKTAKNVWQRNKTTKLFFIPAVQFAVQSLEVGNWKNAADYEPMETSVNKAAIAKMKTINWDDYNYSVILVPGAGPEDPTLRMMEEGRQRCRVAAMHYKEKLAPFLVVSGGRVHPYKTKYNEAQEMKRYMMDSLKIPEEAIIMEPQARHTTTNMRNTARLIFRYGMPFTKSCLVSTTTSQSLYINDLGLDKRSEQELGYVCFRKGMRLTKNDVVFYPVITSLQINPFDPLDP